MKTIYYLRLNTMFTKGLIEDFNKKYKEVFSFVHVDNAYTQIMIRNIESKSSEQLVKELTTLNNCCKRILPSFRCHIQGVIILAKEQKAIFCHSKKIDCYDFSDTAKPISDFISCFGCFDREIAGTNEMIVLADLVADLNEGYTPDFIYKIYQKLAEKDKTNRYFSEKCKLLNLLI